jgi:flagellar biosynthesis protein FliQ
MAEVTHVLVIVIAVLGVTLVAMGVGSIYSILQANKRVVEMAFQSLPPAVLTILQQAFGDLSKLTALLQDLLEPDPEEDGDESGGGAPPALG